MAEAKKLGEVYKFNKHKKNYGKATIVCDNGECILDSDIGIMGIELNFKGKAEITPTLPDDWILQGNNNKIIIFTLQNSPIQKTSLFTYTGSVEIRSVIISDKNANKLHCTITKYKPKWNQEQLGIDIDAQNWDDKKDSIKVGKVKKTTYNLPDYDLPKVDKKEIKKLKKQKRTQTSQRTYIRTTTSSGSSGSGGY